MLTEGVERRTGFGALMWGQRALLGLVICRGPRVPSHATAREAGVRCPDYVHGQQVKRAQCQRVSD